LITRTILGEQCWSLNSLFSSYLHFPISHPSYTQIFSSALYSQTPSAYVPSSMSVTMCLTHTKQ
jgi:hypothetical protein